MRLARTRMGTPTDIATARRTRTASRVKLTAITGIAGRAIRTRQVRHTTQDTGTMLIAPADGGADGAVGGHARRSHDAGGAIRASGSVVLDCGIGLSDGRRPILAIQRPGGFQIAR